MVRLIVGNHIHDNRVGTLQEAYLDCESLDQTCPQGGQQYKVHEQLFYVLICNLLQKDYTFRDFVLSASTQWCECKKEM